MEEHLFILCFEVIRRGFFFVLGGESVQVRFPIDRMSFVI